MKQITQLDAWQALEKKANPFLYEYNHNQHPILSNGDISLDFNGQSLNNEIYSLLLQLAEQCNLQAKIDELFSGYPVNRTENKPALHWALRASLQSQCWLDDCNIMSQIHNTLKLVDVISTQIRCNRWLGFSGKAITDIVNLGIGGSYLGPYFCLHALADLQSASLDYHFICDFDPNAFKRVTKHLNPETTLFIVSSKSFMTAETLYNLKQAKAWINKAHADRNHFIAVTAAADKAVSWGIEHILPIWDWVGGRYSVCSAINLITCIAIGFDAFTELLQGAASMDAHFRHTAFAQNMPVNLALLGIWTNNFLNIHQLLILTYAQNLDHFTNYIQQLDMESNGKSVDLYGRKVGYHTAPIIWGGSGNQAQHSYYQLLCQGTHHIAADLISVDAYEHTLIDQLCSSQKEVLTASSYPNGNGCDFIREHTAINHIRLKDMTPRTIGALIALYEHKIYTQGVIWQVNSFDQPGVESSKKLMQNQIAHV
ncbi:MAG: glucose-6-phosphate isomerase [Legionella sp.]